MMYRSLSVCAAVAISASLVAQATTTLPVGHDKVEGKYSRHVPLRYNPARIQCGYDQKATGWKAPKLIKELWVRADQSGYLTTGFSVDMQVILSSKGADPKTASMKYANNLGADQLVFMKKKTYKFAPFVKGTTFPNKWSIQLKGDRVFVALAPQLVVDWATYAKANQSNSNIYVDGASVTGTWVGTSGTYSTYGTSCNPSTFYNYSTGYNEGQAYRSYAYTRNSGDLVLSWLGASKIGVAIPGLKGCTLYTAPLLFNPAVVKTTSTSGYANFPWGLVPAGMKGKKVWAQSGAIDSTFKQMRFSRGNEVTFGDRHQTFPMGISHKYNYGSGSRAFNPDKDDPIYGWEGVAIVFDVR